MANTCKIAYGAIPFAGATLAQTEDGPDGYANFTSSTATPYYDIEFIQAGSLLYYNCERGLIRVESSTVQRRAGNYPVAVSCIKRPIQVSVTGMSRAGTTVTVNTPFEHGYVTGLLVTMTSAGEANFVNGEKTVVTVPTATSFTYTEAGAAVPNGTTQIFAASNLVGSSGYMATNDRVAYRALLTEFDTNGVAYQGGVSGRIVVTNAAPFVGTAANKNVQLAVLFPAGLLAANTKMDVYRSRTAASAEPNDVMGLVYTKYLHADDVARGYVWFTDINPDATIGKALYTNSDQDGIQQSNERPATAKTVALWRDRMVLANTFDFPAIEMQLLSTDSASGGLAAGEDFSWYNPSLAAAVTFSAYASIDGFSTSNSYTVYTGGTASIDVKHTVLSLVDSINWNGCGGATTTISPMGTANATYLSTGTDWPGRFTIKFTIPNQREAPTPGSTYTEHAAVYTTLSARGAFAPKLGVIGNTTSSSVTRASNITSVTMAAAYKFEVGEFVQLWVGTSLTTVAGTSVEGKILTINTGTGVITIDNPGSNGSVGATTRSLRLKYQPEFSNHHQLNNLIVSRPAAVEAFPPENTLRVGQRGGKILKCVPCKDSLLVFKEDGLFRVTASGNYGEVLASELLDPNAILWAKDTAVAMQGKVVAWLTKGVAIINEQGVEKYVSERIQDRLRPATSSLSEPDILSYPFSRRAQAFVDEVNGLYELRICLTTGPSAPYASTVNVVYDMLNDTWVEDDLAVVSEAFYQNRRYIIQGTSLYAQSSQVYSGLGTGAFTGFSATTTDDVYNFTYTGSVTVGSAIIGEEVVFTPVYVLSASGGVGTVYAPGNSLAALQVEGIWGSFNEPVVSTVQWAPITLADENKVKRFAETQMLFGVRENLVAEVSYSTDLVTTEETLVCKLGAATSSVGVNGFAPYNLRTLVTQQHRLGQQLNIKLVIRTAYGAWTVLGLGVAGANVSTRLNR
ncbi:MAG: hypothetical protein IPJ65_38110 [Archangiaceae bacterium]|nr:hypothetical protein [Archangiaceae bacterium]